MSNHNFKPGDLVRGTPNCEEKLFRFMDAECTGTRLNAYTVRQYPGDSLFIVLECFFVSNPNYGIELNSFWAVRIGCPDGRIAIATEEYFTKFEP